VLDKVDRKNDAVLASIIDDHWRYLNTKKRSFPIFWEFIEKERNNILKTFEVGIKIVPHTIYTHLDRGLSYQQIVERHGEFWDLIFGDEEESGLEVADKAYEWWDENLRVIEMAWLRKIPDPFTSDRIWELLNESYELERTMRE
jgi:hypothetical protein